IRGWPPGSGFAGPGAGSSLGPAMTSQRAEASSVVSACHRPARPGDPVIDAVPDHDGRCLLDAPIKPVLGLARPDPGVGA
ncbi:MAG: hypothetical protein QNJ62_13115, partial [Methyloceanibacter sp.]|nr:hypothetical protein [Methyloceanibacter sp.]